MLELYKSKGIRVALSLGLFPSKEVAFIIDRLVFVIAVIGKAIMFITERHQNTYRPMDFLS